MALVYLTENTCNMVAPIVSASYVAKINNDHRTTQTSARNVNHLYTALHAAGASLYKFMLD